MIGTSYLTTTTTTASWVVYTDNHTVNPADSQAWEVADVNAMTIGIQTRGQAAGQCDVDYVNAKVYHNLGSTVLEINGNSYDDGWSYTTTSVLADATSDDAASINTATGYFTVRWTVEDLP